MLAAEGIHCQMNYRVAIKNISGACYLKIHLLLSLKHSTICAVNAY